MTSESICKLAHELELTFNPYCGYQDPYGCGIGGFKRIEFLENDRIRYEYLDTDIFNQYDVHLVFSGVTRNSKKVLKNVTDNLDKIKPLLNTVEKAHQEILNCDFIEFFKLFKEGWIQKKNTSTSITENNRIREIDNYLEIDQSVIAHKLCGAGNGGFFLTFSEKNSLTLPYDSVKINVVSEGVLGESI
tara:strand:- start:1996 stop:2562 length:567 start_codon:yes stop_codon:yes gene_type:complete